MLCKFGEICGVCPASGGAELGVLFQPFCGVFSDRLQHDQSGLSSALIHLPNQALIHKGGQPIENVHPHPIQMIDARGHRFGFFERATGEYGEQPKQPLFISAEQLITPVNRIAQCLLPNRQVTCPSA